MIKNKTVFVLGAGASIPYGFPSGLQLKDDIYHMLKNPGGMLHEVLAELGQKKREVESFNNDLARSPDYSVDAFLEHRPDYLDIGKTAIAAALLPQETTHRLFEAWIMKRRNKDDGSEKNWYQYLFHQLDTTFDNFDKNQIAFITFNYDRSLEQYLYTSLRSKYKKKSEDECAEKINQIPIIHIYGTLGYLPWQKKDEAGIPYDSITLGIIIIKRHIKQAVKSIKIIHEESPKTEEFRQAHELLRQARRIYFLGFGFNDINVKRLVPEDVRKKAILRGTAYGLSPHQRRKIHNLGFSGIMGVERFEGTKVIWTQFPDVKIYDYLYHDQNAILD